MTESFPDSEIREKFLGKAGELVPAVDPDDIKAVWKLRREHEARFQGKRVGIGRGLVESICKAGADVRAVCYRATMLQLIQRFAPEKLVSWLTPEGEPSETVFQATAQVAMTWIPEGGQQGLPIDEEQFFRIVRGEM
jgi:hypothetical protein